MKKKVSLTSLLVLVWSFLCLAQTDNLSQLSWTQVKLKAKTDNKYIFMDCYATWCIPCKWMDKNILSDTSVVNYLNKNFISLKVQFDKTKHDSKNVISWYQDAKQLESDLLIQAFPTYIFFSPYGIPIGRFEGITNSKSLFISKVEEMLNSNKQISISKYSKQTLGDSIRLRNLIIAARSLKNLENADSLTGLYLKVLKQPYTAENIGFAYSNIKSSKYYSFQWLINNSSSINLGIQRDAFAQKIIAYIIRTEFIDSVLRKNNNILSWKVLTEMTNSRHPVLPDTTWTFIKSNFENSVITFELSEKYTMKFVTPNWAAFTNYLEKKYYGIDWLSIVRKVKPTHYWKLNDWNSCAKSMLDYLKKGDLDDSAINDKLWQYVFMKADDRNALQSALKLSKRMIDKNPGKSMYLDTYANLLYKLGKNDLALKWEILALELEKKQSKPSLVQIKVIEDTVEKIKMKVKTWEN